VTAVGVGPDSLDPAARKPDETGSAAGESDRAATVTPTAPATATAATVL
jgi:hypothetical protein